MSSATATKRNATTKIDFDAIDSLEHRVWKQHRELLLAVPGDDAGYRGCLGFGILVNQTTSDSWITVDSGDHRMLFVPNRTLSVLSLVDIPLGFFRLGERTREVHWATVRPFSVRYGVPCIERGTEEHNAWDFRQFPFDKAKLRTEAGDEIDVHAQPDVLSPSGYPQLFRALNAMELAMTSTAFMFRKSWQNRRKVLYDALGQDYAQDRKLLLFGCEPWDHVQRPDAWMPRAYLAFPEKIRDRVFDRATRPLPGMPPVYSTPLQSMFLKAVADRLTYHARFNGVVKAIDRETVDGLPVLTFRLAGDKGESARVRFTRQARVLVGRGQKFATGQPVASENFKVPEDWADKSPRVKWERWLPRLLGGTPLNPFLRIWFDRQAVDLIPGYVHFPSEIASAAALGNAVDAHLYWDVNPAMPYYREDCDCFVFPTLQVPKWDAFRGVLPGDVAYDFEPSDPRFTPLAEKKAGNKKGKPKPKAKGKPKAK